MENTKIVYALFLLYLSLSLFIALGRVELSWVTVHWHGWTFMIIYCFAFSVELTTSEVRRIWMARKKKFATFILLSHSPDSLVKIYWKKKRTKSQFLQVFSFFILLLLVSIAISVSLNANLTKTKKKEKNL